MDFVKKGSRFDPKISAGVNAPTSHIDREVFAYLNKNPNLSKDYSYSTRSIAYTFLTDTGNNYELEAVRNAVAKWNNTYSFNAEESVKEKKPFKLNKPTKNNGKKVSQDKGISAEEESSLVDAVANEIEKRIDNKIEPTEPEGEEQTSWEGLDEIEEEDDEDYMDEIEVNDKFSLISGAIQSATTVALQYKSFVKMIPEYAELFTGLAESALNSVGKLEAVRNSLANIGDAIEDGIEEGKRELTGEEGSYAEDSFIKGNLLLDETEAHQEPTEAVANERLKIRNTYGW